MINEFKRGIPADEYHQDLNGPSLSASIATTLCNQSAAHAWLEHPRLGGARYAPTKAMDLGTLIHALILGTGPELVIVEEKDWRKDVAKAAKETARAAGKLAVLEKEIHEARHAASRIRARMAEMMPPIDLTGESELAVYWSDSPGDGPEVRCRGQMDHLVIGNGRATIYDLKVWESANPEKFGRKFDDFGGDIQSAAYVRAVEKVRPDLAGRVDFVWLVAEPEAPWCVTPAEPTGLMREVGATRWCYALDKWRKCLAAGKEERHWPGYTRSIVGVDAPPWALAREAIRQQ